MVCLVDVPVQTKQSLESFAGDATRGISSGIIAKRLQLSRYLVGFFLSDLAVIFPWDVGRRNYLLDIFTVSEEEELILDDRTTEGEAHRILVLLVELLAELDILTSSRAIEVLIVIVVIDRAVEGIRPRLGDSVHTATREARLTNIKGSNDHLQGIDCLKGDRILA